MVMRNNNNTNNSKSAFWNSDIFYEKELERISLFHGIGEYEEGGER